MGMPYFFNQWVLQYVITSQTIHDHKQGKADNEKSFYLAFN